MTDALRPHADRLNTTTIASLFDDGTRNSALSVESCGIHLDLTRQRLDAQALAALHAYAAKCGLPERRAALFAGAPINTSENRPALHMALRDVARDWMADGQSVSLGLRHEQARATGFACGVREGSLKAADGNPYSAIIHVGVGGSDLGVRLVHDALAPLAPAFTLRFAANIDPYDVAAATAGLDPARTLIVAVSKSFGTQETLANLDAIRAWFCPGPGEQAFQAQTVIVTAAPAKALANGFSAEQIFSFPDWVGGRYSLWSSVGLALEIALGPDVIASLRAGASAMDRNFETAAPDSNLPLLAGLTGYWNRTVLSHSSRATVPYATRLRLLPAFLQQLDMESNGKSVGPDGKPVAHLTAPVGWGAEGTNGQHAFFQQLHQGPEPVPVDFVAPWCSDDGPQAAQDALIAHTLAQAEALLIGRSAESFMAEHRAKGMNEDQAAILAAQRACPGNRPSSIISMERLTPASLGALLAFFEHRTFVEGVLWGVNSFDQWGVELGKVLAARVDAAMASGNTSEIHPSTAQSLVRWRAASQTKK